MIPVESLLGEAACPDQYLPCGLEPYYEYQEGRPQEQIVPPAAFCNFSFDLEDYMQEGYTYCGPREQEVLLPPDPGSRSRDQEQEPLPGLHYQPEDYSLQQEEPHLLPEPLILLHPPLLEQLAAADSCSQLSWPEVQALASPWSLALGPGQTGELVARAVLMEERPGLELGAVARRLLEEKLWRWLHALPCLYPLSR